MAGKISPEADDTAEKAYAAAAEAIGDKPGEPEAVEFPSKAKRGRKPRVMTAPVLPEDDLSNSALPQTASTSPASLAASAPSVVPETIASAAATSPKPAKTRLKPPVVGGSEAPAAAPTSLAGSVEKSLSVNTISNTPLPKEKTMATQSDFTQASAYTPGADFTANFKTAFSDVQDKAKAAFEKSSSALGEYTEFAKGNVEAAVESGKILASGLQELGGSYAAEGKSAFETLTADVKELTAAKTPVDFFRLQGELARRNFESAAAFGSKSSEAMLKLATAAFAPLSGRVSVAVDKIKHAA